MINLLNEIKENNKTLISIQLQYDEMLDEAYENIITCFMNLEQYHKASAYCSLAKRRNKYNDKVKKLETIIKTYNVSKQETEKVVDELNQELDTISEKNGSKLYLSCNTGLYRTGIY